MRLRELEPQFIRHRTDEQGRQYQAPVLTIEEAQGIRFLCPLCYAANGGPIGTHGVVCWSRSRGVPDDVSPGPGRWALRGTGYDDLTLDGDSPAGPGTGARSVLLTGGCAWHGFITNGEAHA